VPSGTSGVSHFDRWLRDAAFTVYALMTLNLDRALDR
jgi:hypothetical protein